MEGSFWRIVRMGVFLCEWRGGVRLEGLCMNVNRRFRV